MNRRFSSLLASGAMFTLVLAFCAMQQPTGAQTARLGPITQTFTSAASPPIKACGLSGQNSATFQATGSGPIDAQVSNDGVSWTNASISNMAGTAQAQPFTPTSGTTYQVIPLNADCFQITPDSTWSGQTVTITMKASGSIASAGFGGGSGGNVTVVNTPGVNIENTPGFVCISGCGAGGGQTFPTSSPGNAQLVVPANASAAPYTAANPFPVTTPAPTYTGNQTVSGTVTANQGGTWNISAITTLPTPSAGPLATASAGASVPGQAPNINTYPNCVVPAGATPNVTAGNAIAQQCTVNGQLQVVTPGPAATNAADQGINVHIAGSTAAPIAVTTSAPGPTISPGLYPGVTEAGPSAEPGQVNGAYAAVVDSTGNRLVSICGSGTVQCASVKNGVGANKVLIAGLVPGVPVVLSAASGACTSITTSSATTLSIIYASSSAQTGTLTIYNEGASPTCTAADGIYVSVAHGVASVPDAFLMLAANGLAYKWTTAAEVGNVWINYF